METPKQGRPGGCAPTAGSEIEFSSAWYSRRAEETRHNGKTMSQYNYMLAMATERREIEILRAECERLRDELIKSYTPESRDDHAL